MPNLGIDSLKANLTNPARTYLWDLLIPVPIGNGVTETFQIRAQSTQIPSVSAGSIHIPYKQTAGVELVGKKVYTHEWACTFLEGEDHKTYDALYSWSQVLIHDVAGVGVGEPLYKTDVYVSLITVAGDTYMKFRLKGAWVQTVNAVDLAYNADGLITYNVAFRFDSFEVVTV